MKILESHIDRKILIVLVVFFMFLLVGITPIKAFAYIRWTIGSTAPGATDWRELRNADGTRLALYTVVDIGINKLPSNPIFISSLEGINSHWTVIGATSIYKPTPDGFRVYMKHSNGAVPSAEFANQNEWRINWLGIESPNSATNIGSTPPGATNWKVWRNYDGRQLGIYVDVDTSSARFTSTPSYFTSLGGDTAHWSIIGATSIYNATPNGFRVYIKWADGRVPTVALANKLKWHINWFAYKQNGAGRTTPGATDWKELRTRDGTLRALYVDVDTRSAEFTSTPVYFTSLGGSTGHWSVIGATSIYKPTPNGFRVYIKYSNGTVPTAESANRSNWHINWKGFKREKPPEPFFQISGTTKNSVTLYLFDLHDSTAGYAIWRKSGTIGYWHKITELFIRNRSMVWNDTGLRPDTQYCYFIQAINNFGKTDSVIKCTRTKPEPQDEPELADLNFNRPTITQDPAGQLYVYKAFTLKIPYHNSGEIEAGPHSIAVYYDGNTNPDIIIQNNDVIGPGELGEIRLNVPLFFVTSAGEHTFEFELDSENEVEESNENNNSYEWTHDFKWGPY